MSSYSPPFRLYLVTDPTSDRRHQISDRASALSLAQEFAKRSGKPVSRLMRPSKYWYTYRYVGNRRTTRVNTKQRTKHEAKIWIDAKRLENLPAGASEPRKILLDDALQEWHADRRMQRISEKNLRDCRYLGQYWIKFLGNVLVSCITIDDILSYFHAREAGKIGKARKPSKRLLLKERTVLNIFFKWCSARGRRYCATNPIAEIPRWRTEDKEPRVLDQGEIHRLLDACRSPFSVQNSRSDYRPYSVEQTFRPPDHLYGIVLLALHTLLRQANILGLTWGQIDLERGTIRIPASQIKNRKDHLVNLTPTVRRYLGSRDRGAPAALVFPCATDNIRRSFKSAAKRAKLEGIRFHDLRKTGATLLMSAGVPLATVQRMGGWKRSDVLLKHYAGVFDRDRERALEVLDRIGG